ncbi:glycoside hydrolase family 2 protein [Labilibacter marinus]|uniref:glycoside hydrolase family 2 protein n=1 Tax=Labilibacter marinus TaxID=1477105 RepID=UPI0009500446|nr:glycoside hydrolase family 2 [Labilibacter marinus]
MKTRIFIALFVLGLSIKAQQNINSNWFFKKGEAENALDKTVDLKEWKEVELPHTYNPSGSAEVYREQKVDVSYTGQAWYRKSLMVDNKLKGKRLFLHFDAVYIDANVYINGERIGNHKGGYSAFAFEITDKVKYGSENLISVSVSNKYNPEITPLSGGYIKFGGITRPVSLIVKEKFCISPVHYATTGVYCKPKNITKEKAELEIETVLNSSQNLSGKSKVVCAIYNENKKLVAKETFKVKRKEQGQWHINIPITVENPELWNGLENPALYTVKVELYNNNHLLDEITETTGFKNVHVDRDKGFFLNGNAYPLYGAAQHQYYPGVGSAMRPEHFDEDLELMLDIGLNAMRFSHYPHSKYRLDLCDKHGIIAFSEIAFIGWFNETEAFTDNCKQQIHEMVYQQINHPSVAIWGLFNEITSDVKRGFSCIPLVNELNGIAKEIDPSRLTCGVSWKAGERNDVADLSGWNRYQGWYWNAYPGSPGDFTWLDNMRKEFPNRKYGITEYGGGGTVHHFDENRKAAPYNQDQFHPVDFYNYSHEEHWKAIQKRPWLWGTFIWTLTEFLVPGYDQGSATYLHDKALVGENHTDKKDAYYFYKANWKKEPVFHLAYKQFDIRLNDEAEVTVYSNLDAVKLAVDGVDYGTLKNAENGVFRWNNIPLKAGNNNIVVSSNQDGKSYQESATWTFVEDMHTNKRVKELVKYSDKWNALFREEQEETKKKRGSGIPGEEINATFNASLDVWSSSSTWDEVQLPLSTKTQTSSGNWPGKMVYLTKTFEVTGSSIINPHIYLKQTAALSKENAGRISIAIDEKAILTLEEGFEDYRLIPVKERLGELKPGKHTISIIANTPEKGGVLDVGFVEIIKP